MHRLPTLRAPWRSFAVALLAAVLLLTGALPPPSVAAAGKPDPAAIQRQMNQKRAQLSALQSSSKRTAAQLDTTQQKLESQQTKLSGLQKNIAQTQALLTRRQNELTLAQRRLEQLKQDLAQAVAELQAQQETLGKRIRATYENGYVSYLDVLFQASSFRDLVTRFAALQAIIASDVDLLHQVEEQRQHVEANKADQETQVARAQQLTAQVAASKQQLETQRHG